MPELFEARAASTPDATAVVHAEAAISYGELNAAANRLARLLAGLGAGPEQVVGLCLDRGVELVTSVLAVAKAGAAYLPVDPGYPAQRIAFMLADSQAGLLVSRRQVAVVGDLAASRVVWLDDPEVAAGVAACPPAGPAVDRDGTVVLQPEHAAYVIYTSGSAGVPKGCRCRMPVAGELPAVCAGCLCRGRCGVGAAFGGVGGLDGDLSARAAGVRGPGAGGGAG